MLPCEPITFEVAEDEESILLLEMKMIRHIKIPSLEEIKRITPEVPFTCISNILNGKFVTGTKISQVNR